MMDKCSFEIGCRSKYVRQDSFKCDATLLNQDLWEKFRNLQTEMIITKTGRRMFPSIRVQVSGLDPCALYCILIEMTPVSDTRYKYSSVKGWQTAGSGEAQSLQRVYMHPESPSTGTQWMSQPLTFSRMKLTNSSSAPNDQVILNSMHKYQPRIIILRAVDPRSLNWAPSTTIRLPETEFIAVTAYQNEKITRLKIDHNPFAKGFREGGQARYKRKRVVEESKQIDIINVEDCDDTTSSGGNNNISSNILYNDTNSTRSSPSSCRTSESPDAVTNSSRSCTGTSECTTWIPAATAPGTFWPPTPPSFYNTFPGTFSYAEQFKYLPHYNPFYPFPTHHHISSYVPSHYHNMPQPQDLSTSPKKRKLTDFSIRAIVDSNY